MEHKKTHMCVERPIPRKVSRSYSCIFDASSPYRARRLLRGEIDRFVAIRWNVAGSTSCSTRQARVEHIPRTAGPAHPHAPRCPIVPGLRNAHGNARAESQGHRVVPTRDSTPQVILRPQTRVQTCYCSRSYTHKVRLRRPWNGDWRSFFVLKSVDSLPLEARWSWQLPTGAESPLPTVTAGWLRCPPAEPQSRGLSDYSPIHTPIFSSPPLLLCSPMHTVERPTPFWVRPILCFCGATQNFMQ